MGTCEACGPRLRACTADPTVPLNEFSCLPGSYYDANDNSCKDCGTT